MEIQERKARFLPLNPAEQLYKKLYSCHSAIYFYDQTRERYRDWQEFKAAYGKEGKRDVRLPDDAPTHMGRSLLESTFFLDDDKDVSMVLNARYCPPFWHHLKFIKIMYVLSGRLVLNTGYDKSIELLPGNFVIVPPELEQSVFSHHDEDIVANIFLRSTTFENAFFSLLMESKELSSFFWKVLYGKDESSIIWCQSSPDAQLDQFVLDMYDEVEKPRSNGNFFLVSYVMAFLAYALCRYQDKITSIQDTQLRKDKFPEIIQYIRENYSTVTLATLSEHFQKSEGHLCRYVKKETGYSLTHLLREFRIRRAAVLLRNSDCSVEEIMLQVGYTDISYFYKVFKGHYQMTPSQYRRQEKIIHL